MMALANATQHDVNKLKLNGQSMFIGSSLSKDAVTSVLDRYESLCQKNRAQSGDEWRSSPSRAPRRPTARQAIGNGGIVRSGDDSEGAVICFTKTNASKATFSEAVHTFAQTGELGALGAVRYVYAHKTDTGSTVVLTAWTDEQVQPQVVHGRQDEGLRGRGLRRSAAPERLDPRHLGPRRGHSVRRERLSEQSSAPPTSPGVRRRQLSKEGLARPRPRARDHMAIRDDKHHPVGRIYEKDGVVLTLASHLEPDSTFTTMGLAGVTGQVDTGTATRSRSTGVRRRASTRLSRRQCAEDERPRRRGSVSRALFFSSRGAV